MARFASSAFVVIGLLVGCNLHSGSGINPDEYLEGGSDGGSGSSSGNSGSGSGGNGPDAAEAEDAASHTLPGNDATTIDAGPGSDAGNPGNPGECPADPNTCVDCCGNFEPAGYQEFLADVAPCLCNGDAGEGVCEGECATELCAGAPYASEEDACEQCVNTNTGPGDFGKSQCLLLARQDCTMQSTCSQFFSCRQGCPQGE
jgi:hypothetical protein